ncbi:hypothetical protein RND71_014115 [Anisodus tanguticus]|uniref:Replication factor A C-terminal domain-containing protein n=1 Tax=Anisodus tanguticus TaxID=243964 RepID=A0AAE1VND6_9SOLA|nr:hypothetical protein RND71_014115 [Anisodus tanguticus]
MNEDQRFCIIACSGCHKLFPRHFSLRVFYCTTCHQTTHLTPKCRFEVTIIDNTGFASTTISDKIGEELLSLTSEEIYGIRCHKILLPVKDLLLFCNMVDLLNKSATTFGTLLNAAEKRSTKQMRCMTEYDNLHCLQNGLWIKLEKSTNRFMSLMLQQCPDTS